MHYACVTDRGVESRDVFILYNRSNFVGTEFVLFDAGVSPSELATSAAITTASVRQELGAVIYV